MGHCFDRCRCSIARRRRLLDRTTDRKKMKKEAIMGIYTWYNGSVPAGMKVRQVSGLLFSRDGYLLVMGEMKNGQMKYSLPGGHPEREDLNFAATLKREVWEEINTTIAEPILVGYQQVNEQDGTSYAQVRMTALIGEIGTARPDIDNGKLYQRLLVPPLKAAELLNWGEVGLLQVKEAMRIVAEHFGITPST